ncbi:hypothetical protein D3H55_01310 [Bacillus salacetis]|uniref:Uncharacterized protein n=1 Tax=Bacillus salacetis TaxID=2315464 RepID=A0A3A1R962_9BACI|nr:hypothetical protein [Bacillus salacetis]RIW39019.1 hypothetical protein D3H55_01310 [Bacillus salacetis]
MKWYSIGAFSSPSAWAALAAAFIVTGIFLRLYFGKNNNEWFGNSVFYFILTWKLSIILFDFAGVIRQPLSILYFNGGSNGFWLGAAAALLYIFFKGEKRQLIIAWMLVVLVYEGASDFLADSGTMMSALILLISFCLFYLLLKRGKAEVWLLLFIVIQLLNNFFQGSIISTESMAYFIITICVLAMSRIRRSAP